jgi:hypothetical protein
MLLCLIIGTISNSVQCHPVSGVTLHTLFLFFFKSTICEIKKKKQVDDIVLVELHNPNFFGLIRKNILRYYQNAVKSVQSHPG